MPSENFWIGIQADLSEDAPEGPGWYVYAARTGATLIPAQRIGKVDAIHIGNAFHDILDTGDKPIPVTPDQLINSGNALISQAIDAQLAKAEEHAKRIAKLRKLQAAEKEQESITNDVRRTGDGNGHGSVHPDTERGWIDPGRTANASGGPSSIVPDTSGSGSYSDGNYPSTDVSERSS